MLKVGKFLGKGESKEAKEVKEAPSSAEIPSESVDQVSASSDVSASPSVESTPSISSRLDVEFQLSGNLFKKDTAGSSSWTERYFILKDSFLLYYPERNKSNAISFDMHPKGVVPLDSAEIELVKAGPKPTLQCGIRINHSTFGTKSVLLCAANEEEQNRWFNALENSRNVTSQRVASIRAENEGLKQQLEESQSRFLQLSQSLGHVEALATQTKHLLNIIAAVEKKFNIVIDPSNPDCIANIESGRSVKGPHPPLEAPPSEYALAQGAILAAVSANASLISSTPQPTAHVALVPSVVSADSASNRPSPPAPVPGPAPPQNPPSQAPPRGIPTPSIPKPVIPAARPPTGPPPSVPK